MNRRLIACSLFGAAVTTGFALQTPVAQGADDAIVIHSSGIEGLLPDEKDAGLRRALAMLADRIQTLPEELGEPDMPASLLSRIAHLVQGPMTFRGGMIPNANPEQGPPFYLVLSASMESEQAARAQADAIFADLKTTFGELPASPVEEHPGLRLIDLDGAPLYLGAAEVGGQPAFVVALNTMDFAAPQPPAVGLPEGIAPAGWATFDSTTLQPFFEMMLENAGPEADMARMQLKAMGLLGEHPLAMAMAAGHGEDRSHFVITQRNARQNPSTAAMLSDEPLSANDLRLIPADATMASISKMRLSAMTDMIDGMIESAQANGLDAENPWSIMEREIGINPKTDLLQHLGDTVGYYASESTGGGGMLSSVLFLAVNDEAAVRDALSKLYAKANEMAASEANGYVRFRTRSLAGHEVTTLSFPGLPVPLELSSALHDGHLYIGATPQALVGALTQAKNGRTGLMENASFNEMGGAGAVGAMAASFIDTPRLIDRGYGMLTLAASALANVAQSPADGSLDPGLVLPSYPELAADAKATVSITRFDGDDLVTTAQMDRSDLVNAAGAMGALGSTYGGVILAAMSAGAFLPALEQARESAQQAKGIAQMRQVGVAVVMYAENHDGRFPISRDELVTANLLTEDMFSSPFGPVHDGEGDYWYDFRGQENTIDSNRIIGYDRAMAAQMGMVSVLFADGHVEMIDFWNLTERFNDPKYEGIDFNPPEW